MFGFIELYLVHYLFDVYKITSSIESKIGYVLYIRIRESMQKYI